jgi:hypothetical protein
MEKIFLPEPIDNSFSLFKAIKKRKSIRDYSNEPLNIDEISFYSIQQQKFHQQVPFIL